jgi:hypothetical protein
MDRDKVLFIATTLLSGRLARTGSVNPEIDAKWAFDTADALIAEGKRRAPDSED